MYAHKVIEDLEKIHAPVFKEHATEWIPFAIAHIKNAQKFSLPDHNSLGERKSPKGFGEMTGFDPPYDLCWFDFNGKTSANEKVRFGLIVETIEKDLFFQVFSWFEDEKIWVPSLVTIRICLEDSSWAHRRNFEQIADDEEMLKKEAEVDIIAVTHVLKCLEILNCKNIETKTNEPPLNLNKKRKKSGKQELFSFKTIVLTPTGKKQKQQNIQGLWNNRVHLCRGHFKEFTEEKPLFGKVTGRFWWQPTARGNSSEGVIAKDYKLDI